MKVQYNTGSPSELKLLDDNARYMKHETFQRLVSNIKRDGALQQWPFIYCDPDTGDKIVLSGNHRVMAATEAGLETIDWIETTDRLTWDQQKQIQLSHNAIAGEDDPDILKRIYESIESVDEKMASGLDDETLALMIDADSTPLSEINLDFMNMSIVFLPHEYDRAVESFEDARKMAPADTHWIARDDQYDATLAAIEDARGAAHVMNVSTALDELLTVWDEHREDLASKWIDGEGELRLQPHKIVPTSTLFGLSMTAAQGQTITHALKRVIKENPHITTNTEALIHLAENTTPNTTNEQEQN